MQVQPQTVNSYAHQTNVGQVARLQLLPIQAVLRIFPPGSLPTAEPLTVSRHGLAVREGAPLTELLFPTGGCTFQENSSTDAAGQSWSPELQLIIPKNQESLLAWIDANSAHRWLAIWLDRNGRAYVAGEPGNGLRLEVARTIAATNQVALTLKSRYSHPTWFLETFDARQLFGAAEFDYSFSISFSS